LRVLFSILFLLAGQVLPGQVRVRVFADRKPESVIFSVSEGSFVLDTFTDSIVLEKGGMAVIAGYNGKLAVRTRNAPGFVIDSLVFRQSHGNSSFSLMVNDNDPQRRKYSGDLFCKPDLETIVMINIPLAEDYVAGVVMAEGGSGKNIEYFKTQGVLARTYMYKYMNKHANDGYNLCDNTHCQAFNGTCTDPEILTAAMQTTGLVIFAPDSALIISAFHSNCGGETADAADVWLTSVPYLKKVKDPYCSGTRNSTWQKSLSSDEWLGMIRKSNPGKEISIAEAGFIQPSRVSDYRIGTMRIPMRDIRSSLNLRSAYFSVYPQNDSVLLEGRGYGHGVGLCQEGAMSMASKGFSYDQIIKFYYSGILISDIGNAKPDKGIE
jgi:stage II sporulation protein D